jgi:hypothetical protein
MAAQRGDTVLAVEERKGTQIFWVEKGGGE